MSTCNVNQPCTGFGGRPHQPGPECPLSPSITPYYTDDWLTLYGGDCLDVMREMPAESVDCVVTSPPYWGLRDYGAEGQLGLERTPEEYVANMVAVFREVRRVLKPSGTCWLNLGSSYSAAAGASGRSQSRRPERAPAYDTDGTALAGSMLPGFAYSDLCDGCRGDSPSRRAGSADTPSQPSVASSPYATGRGSEPRDSEQASPDASPLGVRESTSSQSSPPLPGSCSHCDRCGACLSVLRSSWPDARACARKSWLNYTTFKPKDLVPIPWLVALALQADGWYLRRDVIWAKSNPMPESVTDRPTSSHEYVFLLTKSPRYYFDADAVREPHETTVHRKTAPTTEHGGGIDYRDLAGGKPRNRSGKALAYAYTDGVQGNPAGRNIRSVWSIATRPYPGAHFAVFPPELPERCIKAGSSEKGVCPECGAPWERVVERESVPPSYRPTNKPETNHAVHGESTRTLAQVPVVRTTGWSPTCICLVDVPSREVGVEWELEAPVPVPAVILDPFGGSGTVGMVANRLSRRAILIDLNPEYLKQQMKRNAQTPLGLDAA